ncbi:muramidase (flagellum-specific) [Paenibacillus antri]|uniref:Muramidase (Flagellum-specific) n=1 Tax=Paenibacillus antri TaxID=2582848 RepID=A0A5R9G6X1_9BACL|nr:glucosaminidase domain-containing protein [Paenibacillus antri]TLS50116.1 muramidase (flagellum-specific) [Paenibacillus antri]
MQPSEFLTIVAPVVVSVRVDGGVLFPSVSLAQTILETGWTIPSWNNLVGYKVGSGRMTEYWHGRSVNKATREVTDDLGEIDVQANFRAYDSIEDSLKDQVLLFLGNRARYGRVIEAATPREQAEALQASGYATDPAYAAKLTSIIRSYNLERYDKEAEKIMEALEELRKQVAELQALVLETEPPAWAQATVTKLVERKLLSDPRGDRSFFRTLVVLDRAGAFDRKE